MLVTGSGFTDADYQKQGAEIVATAAEAWAAELSRGKDRSFMNTVICVMIFSSSPTCTWPLHEISRSYVSSQNNRNCL